MENKQLLDAAARYMTEAEQVVDQKQVSLEKLIQKNLRFEKTPDDVVMFWSTLIEEMIEESKFAPQAKVIKKKLINELRDQL